MVLREDLIVRNIISLLTCWLTRYFFSMQYIHYDRVISINLLNEIYKLIIDYI